MIPIPLRVDDLPAVPGAACAGRQPLWDDHIHGEPDDQREARHHRARAICSRCPALENCRSAAAVLDRFATGIWAGELHDPHARRKSADHTRAAS
jgi:WhiB family redox-sensing transcriptional regulator